MSEEDEAAQMSSPATFIGQTKQVVSTLFGPAATEFGVALQGYLIPWTLSNVHRVAEKVKRLRDDHGINVISSLPPRYAFALLEGAAKEDDETLAEMWATLVAKSTDPSSGYDSQKRHIELLKVLDPLQARTLLVLDKRKAEALPPLNYYGAGALARDLGTPLPNTLMALRTMFSLGLVSDYWLQTFDGAGDGAEAFAYDREQSHILLTAFGRDFLNACIYT